MAATVIPAKNSTVAASSSFRCETAARQRPGPAAGRKSRPRASTAMAASRAAMVAVSHVDGPPMTQNRIHGMNPTAGWLASRRPVRPASGG
jgi:hypothetical protein